jgi:murein endopeptidase
MRVSPTAIACVGLIALGGLGTTASAERHMIERGETLEHIARAYKCSVAEIQKANRIDTTLIRAGATLRIPRCKHGKRKVAVVEKKRPRREPTPASTPGEGYENEGVEAVETVQTVQTTAEETVEVAAERPPKRAKGKEVAIATVAGQSVGAPWDGELHDGVRLHLGKGFKIRRPHRAWGASHAVDQIERALESVRDRFPDAHTLAIGDMSARDGGAITEHRSHQSGRDIDIGLYFTKVPDDYPSSFVSANEDLDLRKTWALVQAFAKTADESTGVQAIFLDFGVQGRLYKWARAHDVPRGYLDALFQYPHGRGASEGLIRHEPHHDDHMHVRFKCAPDDDDCRR